MATLRSNAQQFGVPVRCLIGRSRSCDLVLRAADVSSEHATLSWSGAHWVLEDLGSRNGTFLGDHRLAPRTRVMVPEGSRIRFGQDASWTLVDASGPQLLAVRPDGGESLAAADGRLVFTAPDGQLVEIFQDDGRWLCRHGDRVAPLEDRALVLVGQESWRVHLPTAGQRTLGSEDATYVLRLGLAPTPTAPAPLPTPPPGQDDEPGEGGEDDLEAEVVRALAHQRDPIFLRTAELGVRLFGRTMDPRARGERLHAWLGEAIAATETMHRGEAIARALRAAFEATRTIQEAADVARMSVSTFKRYRKKGVDRVVVLAREAATTRRG